LTKIGRLILFVATGFTHARLQESDGTAGLGGAVAETENLVGESNESLADSGAYDGESNDE